LSVWNFMFILFHNLCSALINPSKCSISFDRTFHNSCHMCKPWPCWSTTYGLFFWQSFLTSILTFRLLDFVLDLFFFLMTFIWQLTMVFNANVCPMFEWQIFFIDASTPLHTNQGC
jgi:hypothetical protein